MSIPKKPATNVLSACLALCIVFMLWQGFSAVDHATHTRLYHPTTLLKVNSHLQTRHIKPQTLPKRPVAHPFLQTRRLSYLSAIAPTSKEHPFLLPSTNPPDAQQQPGPPSDTVQTDQSQMSTTETDGGVNPAMVPEEPKMAVPCSHDMSQPCLPDP